MQYLPTLVFLTNLEHENQSEEIEPTKLFCVELLARGLQKALSRRVNLLQLRLMLWRTVGDFLWQNSRPTGAFWRQEPLLTWQIPGP